jgi:hypothetical protein
MPTHKLRYALTTGLLRGITKTFVAYGIPLNNNTFDVFFDIVGELLSGDPEIEYEWSVEEYSRMMEIKSLWY